MIPAQNTNHHTVPLACGPSTCTHSTPCLCLVFGSRAAGFGQLARGVRGPDKPSRPSHHSSRNAAPSFAPSPNPKQPGTTQTHIRTVSQCIWIGTTRPLLHHFLTPSPPSVSLLFIVSAPSPLHTTSGTGRPTTARLHVSAPNLPRPDPVWGLVASPLSLASGSSASSFTRSATQSPTVCAAVSYSGRYRHHIVSLALLVYSPLPFWQLQRLIPTQARGTATWRRGATTWHLPQRLRRARGGHV